MYAWDEDSLQIVVNEGYRCLNMLEHNFFGKTQALYLISKILWKHKRNCSVSLGSETSIERL
jgi:hypothetical protein